MSWFLFYILKVSTSLSTIYGSDSSEKFVDTVMRFRMAHFLPGRLFHKTLDNYLSATKTGLKAKKYWYMSIER